jgi:hypothetical protein
MKKKLIKWRKLLNCGKKECLKSSDKPINTMFPTRRQFKPKINARKSINNCFESCRAIQIEDKCLKLRNSTAANLINNKLYYERVNKNLAQNVKTPVINYIQSDIHSNSDTICENTSLSDNSKSDTKCENINTLFCENSKSNSEQIVYEKSFFSESSHNNKNSRIDLDYKTDLQESQTFTISEPVYEDFEKCEQCLEVVSSVENFL